MEAIHFILELFTSPIWFLALVVFGTLFYFQWSIGQIQNAPRNIPCSRCEEPQAAYFPNTKFCMPCYEILRDEIEAGLAKMEVGRSMVAENDAKESKLKGYAQAIEACKELELIREKFPKHGLRVTDTIPIILEAAFEEQAALLEENS